MSSTTPHIFFHAKAPFWRECGTTVYRRRRTDQGDDRTGGYGFRVITENMLKTLDMSAVTEVMIDQDDLVVLLTQDDRYVLLGSVQQVPGVQVQFTYQIMSSGSGGEPGEVPEPSTLLLLGAGLAGALGCLKRTQHYHTLTGGKTMKQFTIFVLLLLFGVCSTGAALAAEAELQILVIGNGFVRGEEIGCSYSCTKSFEKGTVVHLKAIPFPNARFVEWKVDGQPHAGVITIEGDTVVSAIFERKTEDPMLADGITVCWYNANGGKDYAKIALDEMLIRLKALDEWGSPTEEEYQTAVQQIRHTFHPQAELAIGSPTLLSVNSPQPLEKEQWFQVMADIQSFPYVRWIAPMLYKIPGASWSQVMVGNAMYVYFPTNYTEDQILSIEQTYHLKRVESLRKEKSFVYETGSPLEAIELANHLYESGLVELATPIINEIAAPMSEPDDPLFKNQWHLKNTTMGAVGEDIHVLPVWEKGIKGTDVVIAVVDDGVEFVHPDLAPNKLQPDEYHIDFIEGDHDPIDNESGHLAEGVELIPGMQKPATCASGCHGTAVAGIAAAEGFNQGIGITGVAPFANLIGYRKYLCDSSCIYSLPYNVYEGLFIGGKNRIIDIYNNSWGSGGTRIAPNGDFYDEMVIGATQDDIIYIWGAGNIKHKEIDDGTGNKMQTTIAANTNYYGFTNSRYTIAVGASGQYGEAHEYSAPGATVLVNAPAGLDTTDRLGAEGYNQLSGEIRLMALAGSMPRPRLKKPNPGHCCLPLPQKR